MHRAFQHIRQTWGNHWFLPLLPAAYSGAMFASGELRAEHVVVSVATLVLGWGPRVTQEFVACSYPGVLVALGYDVLRHLKPLFLRPDRVLACELRDLELRFFAVAPDTTLADFFQVHHSPFLDVFFAIPYALFFYIVIGYAIYLFFADRRRMLWFVLAFALIHVMAFAIWLTMPSAPPWYVRAYGCAIDIGAPPDAAALLRVDQILGIHYFEQFYARSPMVFGAMPSMHCAFPMIGLLTAWRAARWRTRPIHIAYTASMIVASVYLDHHWLLDGLAGWFIAILAVLMASALLPLFAPRLAAGAGR